MSSSSATVCSPLSVATDGTSLLIKKLCPPSCSSTDVCLLSIDSSTVYSLSLGFILRTSSHLLGCGNAWSSFLGYKGILSSPLGAMT